MAIPSAPERISIKRRRTDEPVDHLLYQSKKQRVADHVFVRIQQSTGLPISLTTTRKDTTQEVPGIPSIRTSKPGDEIADFHKYKTQQDRELKQQIPPLDETPALALTGREGESKQPTRQFHLTRDLSTTIRPQHAHAGKPKTLLRPHLATFVERSPYADLTLDEMLVKPPVDRIVMPRDTNASPQQPPDTQHAVKQEIATFKPRQMSSLDEDTLADELAALAVEMDDQLDPEIKAAFLKEQLIEKAQRSKDRAHAQLMNIQPDDYVFETYVRLKKDDMMDWTATSQEISFGYLVIDEEEEDLWQLYLKDENDSDDEWNDEDEDSNAEDNPRNDYPDEELSSDDEFGMNAYKYRNYGSDDEHYDEDED